MFDAIGHSKALKIVLFLNAALAVILATDVFGVLPEIPYVSVISISVLTVSTLVFLLGETALFPCLCRLPLVWRLFPNIDGDYLVEISSNWSVIEARTSGDGPKISDDGDVELFQRTGRLTITTRLTRINMRLTMDNGYLSSETVTCAIRKGHDGRAPILFYVYESSVKKPKDTDSDHHMGAAQIGIPQEPRPRVLEGSYWTNRNWHKGLNTAGYIRLTRLSAAA